MNAKTPLWKAWPLLVSLFLTPAYSIAAAKSCQKIFADTGFKALKVLGEGQLTRVLDIGDGWALRTPLRKEETYLSAMTEFYELQQELKAEGVRVVEMDAKRSRLPYEIVVKKEDFLFTLSEFVEALEKPAKSSIPRKTLDLARAKFLEFMDHTWKYESIGDMGTRNVGFNGHEWVLFDFRHYGYPGHMPLIDFQTKDFSFRSTSFENPEGGRDVDVKYLPPDLELAVQKRIQKIRAQVKATASHWYERSSRNSKATKSSLIDRVTPVPLPKAWSKEFSLKSKYAREAFEGAVPAANSLTIEILAPLSVEGKIHTYSVNVKGIGPAKLTLQMDESQAVADAVYKLAEDAKNAGTPYILGWDFLLTW